MTGPAQIAGLGRLTFYDTVQFDVECVRKQSCRYDPRVLLTTVRKVVVQNGAS